MKYDFTGLEQLEPKAVRPSGGSTSDKWDFTGVDKLEPKPFFGEMETPYGKQIVINPAVSFGEKFAKTIPGSAVLGAVSGATGVSPESIEPLSKGYQEHPLTFNIGRFVGGVTPYVVGGAMLGNVGNLSKLAQLGRTAGLFGAVGGMQELARQSVKEGKPIEKLGEVAKTVGKEALFGIPFHYGKYVKFAGKPVLSALGRAGATGAGVAGLQAIYGNDLGEALRSGGIVTALSLIGEVPALAKTILGRKIINEVNRVAKESGLPEGKYTIDVEKLDQASQQQKLKTLVDTLNKLRRVKGKIKSSTKNVVTPEGEIKTLSSGMIESKPVAPEAKPAVKPEAEIPISTLKTELLNRGFNEEQLLKASPEAVKEIVDKNLKPEEVSITSKGELKVIKPKPQPVGLEGKGKGASKEIMAKAGEIAKLPLDQSIAKLNIPDEQMNGAFLMGSILNRHFNKHLDSFGGRILFNNSDSPNEIKKIVNKKLGYFIRKFTDENEKKGAEKVLNYIRDRVNNIFEPIAKQQPIPKQPHLAKKYGKGIKSVKAHKGKGARVKIYEKTTDYENFEDKFNNISGVKKKGEVGSYINGKKVSKKDLPEYIYHTTSHYKSIIKDGILRGNTGSESGGLGGDMRKGVSFTMSKDTAEMIARELGRMKELANNADFKKSIIKYAKEDERIYNLPKGSLNKVVKAALDNYKINKSPADAIDIYYIDRERIGQENGKKIENPLIFTPTGKKFYDTYKNIDIGIIKVPSKNFPNEALIIKHPVAGGHLDEVRVYSDVPITSEIKYMHLGIPLHPEKFLEKDLKPAIRNLKEFSKDFAKGLKIFFAPEGLTPKTWETAKLYRKRAGETAQIAEKIDRYAQKRWDFWNDMPEEERLKYLMLAEEGKYPKGEIGELLKHYRKLFDEAYEYSKELDEKIAYRKDYIPHIFEDSKGVENWLKTYIIRKGKESFAKTREFDLLKDAMDAGFKLKTTNLEELLGIRMASALRSRTLGLWLKDLEERGIITKEKSDDLTAFSTPRGVYYTTPDIARLINRKLQRSWYSYQNLGGKIARGWLNLKNAVVSYMLNLSGFHALFTSGVDMADRAIVGVKKILRGDLAGGLKEIAKLPVSPILSAIRGRKLQKAYLEDIKDPVLKDFVNRLVMAGGRIRMPAVYRVKAYRAFKKALMDKNTIGSMLRLPFAVIEAMQKPILEWYVPKLKLANFELALSDWLESHPNATEQQKQDYAVKLWDSIDNRLGELVYDNLFWQRWFRDLGVASTISLGWQTGIIRESGGAVKDIAEGLANVFKKGKKDPWFADRVLFMMVYPVVMAAIGSLAYWIFNHKRPETIEDMYAPMIDGERIIIPGYTKDFFSLREAIRKKGILGGTGTVASHKLVPLLGNTFDILRNRNYFDAEIRDPNAPVVAQTRQVLEHLFRSNQPISIQSYRRILEANPNAPVWRKSLPFLGLSNAPAYMSRTAIQNEIFDLMSKKFRKQLSYKEWKQVLKKRELRTKIKNGTIKTDDILKAYEEGIIKGDTKRKLLSNLKKFIEDAKLDSDIRAFKHLSIDEQVYLMKKMTRQEKIRYLPYAHRSILEAILNKQGGVK